jgi:hypothetical protein
MNEDQTDVTEERLRRIRETPEHQRTGEDMAILGVDEAMMAARAALEAAGYKLDHLMLIWDAEESPDKNPETTLVGMVIEPNHPGCALQLLAGTMGAVSGAEVDLRLVGGTGQSRPIHHQ